MVLKLGFFENGPSNEFFLLAIRQFFKIKLGVPNSCVCACTCNHRSFTARNEIGSVYQIDVYEALLGIHQILFNCSLLIVV